MAAHLDHDTVTRVIRRALDLEAPPESDGIDVEAVVAAATEAGIDPDAVRESIAWERLGPPPDRARLDRLAGGSVIVVDRLIRTSVTGLLEQLDEWLTVGHHLRREAARPIVFGDVEGASVAWSKRDDVAATLQRTVSSFAGGAALGSVKRVSARLVPVDGHRSIGRLVVDRRVRRTASLVATGGVGAASVAGGAAVATTIAAPFAIVAAPGLALAGGASIAARRRADGLERELERVLDRIDAGHRPTTLVGGVTRRLTRRVRPSVSAAPTPTGDAVSVPRHRSPRHGAGSA